MKKKLVVFSGAGISAESGLKTFRDSDGLWENYNIMDVATREAWSRNPALVLEFYNARRKNIKEVKPNAAHLSLKQLEDYFDVTIVTQNIDDLHERAGSEKVIHLHGEILKMCSERNKDKTYPIEDDIVLGNLAEDGHQLRPFIVWFGEEVPMMEKAFEIVSSANLLMVIGTSLQVYPAAGLLYSVSPNCPIYVIDKNIPPIGRETINIEEEAGLGVPKAVEMILNSET